MRMLFCLAVLLAACAQEIHGPSAGDEAFGLTAEQLDQFTLRAESGDASAASALATHYYAVGNAEEAAKWHTLAAKLGDCTALRVLWDENENAPVPNMNLDLELRAIAEQTGCSL